MVINFFDMMVASLAAWRVAHMLSREPGPWDIFIRIREKLGNSVLGKAMDCVACMSIWLSAIMFFVPGIKFLVIVLAISAMAMLVGGLYELLRASAPTEFGHAEKSYKDRLPGPGTNI